MHVIITAREMVGLAISRWQEYVRNGGHRADRQLPGSDRPTDPADAWGWASFDLADILDRWGSVIPHERIHVLPMVPGGSDPTELLQPLPRRDGVRRRPEMPEERVNEGLGVVEAELLRRIDAADDRLPVGRRPRQLDPRLPRRPRGHARPR